MGDAYHRAEYQRLRLLVLEAAGGRCEIRLPGCSGAASAVDHVQALALGGDNRPENLRACCQACNSRLGVRITNEKRRARKIGRRSRQW